MPILTGSALKNKGIQPMLDAVVDFLPSPLDVPPVIGEDPRTHIEVLRTVDDKEPFSALAFKIAADPFVGKLAFFRVYSGTLKSGSYVYNATKDRKERIGRILQMHANHREEIEEVYAGDIAAAVGLKETFTGDTLTDPEHPVDPRVDDVPGAGHRGEDRAQDEGRPGQAGHRAAAAVGGRPDLPRQDGSRERRDADRRHGRAAPRRPRGPHGPRVQGRRQHRPARRCRIARPSVAPSEGNGRFVRQTGGKGQYGHAVIKMEPREKGAGYEFEDKIVGGIIPREYIKPIDAGHPRGAGDRHLRRLSRSSTSRPRSFDGSYHEVDSSEMAFKIAGSMAVKDAFSKGDPTILEPIMRVEVTMPEQFMGDVIGDLNSRRGHIEGMESRGSTQVVRAFVPLAQMFGYVTDLRSMTQGRASSSMEFSHYAEVPASVASELVQKSKV